jgi:hypothetical protein
MDARKMLAMHAVHLMVRAIVEGWFVCSECGLVAGCPGCVPFSESAPVHLCAKHRDWIAVNGVSERTVWATDESAR